MSAEMAVCVCVRMCACVCVFSSLLTSNRESSFNHHSPSHYADSVREDQPPPPNTPNMTISTISCLLSLPFISLLFIYLHFVHIYSPGNTSFEPLTRAPAILPQTQNFFSPFVSGLTLTRAFSSFDTCFFKSS